MPKKKQMPLRDLFDAHVTAEGEWQKRVEGKIDQVLNVQVNGAVGFENVLRHLWEATGGARWRVKTRKAVAMWTMKHPTIKSVAVWVIQRFIWALIGIATLVLAQKWGIPIAVELFK